MITKLVDLLLTTIYWIINIPFGVIIVNSWMRQRWNKIIPNNIGDDVNYYLVKTLSGKRVVNYRNIFHKGIKIKNIQCIGSIVDWMTNCNSIIWGSGVMYGEEDRMRNKPLRVCAVRGPLTRNYLLSRNISCPEIYGDPALLLPLIYKKEVVKKYSLGVIAHKLDRKNSIFMNLHSIGDSITIIDILNYKSWTDVIDKINECKIIASSSLHGLIIADAYNIPNVWIRFSDKIEGNDFKFQDYFHSVGRHIDAPLDLRYNEFCINKINEIARNYIAPKISLKKLLNACPFPLSNEIKKMQDNLD